MTIVGDPADTDYQVLGEVLQRWQTYPVATLIAGSREADAFLAAHNTTGPLPVVALADGTLLTAANIAKVSDMLEAILRCLGFLTCATALLAFSTGSAYAVDLTISAAASLTNAFQEIGRAYEQANTGDKVLFNFGASGSLLQQITRGAPVIE